MMPAGLARESNVAERFLKLKLHNNRIRLLRTGVGFDGGGERNGKTQDAAGQARRGNGASDRAVISGGSRSHRSLGRQAAMHVGLELEV